MKIGMISMAYTPGGHTKKQFESILPHTKHDIVPFLFLHNSRYPELIDECEQVAETYPSCNYFPYGVNRGCSKSYNEGLYGSFITHGCDIVVGISQDVYYNTPIAFDAWIEDCTKHIHTHYIISNKDNREANYAPFACWICTPLMFKNLGYLDENFFPCQYEDIDINRRCSFLSGKPEANFSNNTYRTEVRSDSTHLTMLSRTDSLLRQQQLSVTHPRCQEYYIRKWGGTSTKEQFIYPFNNPKFGYKIEWENHDKPYGIQYDRTDQDIVKV